MRLWSSNNLNTKLFPATCTCTNTTQLYTSSIVTSQSIHSRRNNSVLTINPISLTTHKHQQQFLKKKKTKWPTIRASAVSLELPLLPFPLDQVLVPSESKTLHLYEARYLKLLDESVQRKSKLFVHFVLEPFVIRSRSSEASFAAKYGCLAFIEKVEQLDIGALVTIRGIGRVTLVKFVKADPFIEGIVIPLQDDVPENTSEISAKTLELTTALQNLNSLEIKLKASKDALMQTETANALKWLEKESPIDSHEAFIPTKAERVSFAALQVVSGFSESELEKLQEEKLKAMDAYDTLERLHNSSKLVKENVSVLLAKLAIQSLNLT